MPNCEIHPDEETNVRCAVCDRYICERDMVATSVGIKCRECATLPSTVEGPPASYARAAAAAALLAGLGGLLLAQAFTKAPALWGASFWVGVFFGAALGEAVRRMSGGHRTHLLALIAAAAAAAGSVVAGLGPFGMVFSASTAVLFLKAGP